MYANFWHTTIDMTHICIPIFNILYFNNIIKLQYTIFIMYIVIRACVQCVIFFNPWRHKEHKLIFFHADKCTFLIIFICCHYITTHPIPNTHIWGVRTMSVHLYFYLYVWLFWVVWIMYLLLLTRCALHTTVIRGWIT